MDRQSLAQSLYKSQLNKSKAKAQWSFSKDQRFRQPKQTMCQSSYNFQSTFSPRKTSFGYGQKMDFTKFANDGPAPTQYNIESSFTPKISRQRGKTFGLGREQANAPCYNFLGNVKEKTSKPGPGWYEQKSTRSSLQFSMGAKTSSSFIVQNKNPGPGSYNPPQLSPDGRYAISTFKNYGTCLFNPKNSQRWAKDTRDKVPPPHYQIVDGLSKNGKYVTSKYRSQRVSSFGYGDRTTFSKNGNNNPGPGSYKVPSEFSYQQ